MGTHSGNKLYVGIGGHVVAIDVGTGAELWRTKLKTGALVTVFDAGDRLFAGAFGRLFCLDSASGSILWCNKLKGLGAGVVAFSAGEGAAWAARLGRAGIIASA
jgi:outer membrane protein assembly factor BamB